MERDFEDAVRRGDGAAVAAALLAGVDVNARDGHGQSALMIAAHRGDLPLVELLLGHGADPDITAKYELSALMLAIVGGHARVARAIARAGADLRIRGSGAPGFAGKTALDLARERGMAELEDVLAGR